MIDFEWYVLNDNANTKSIEPYNIFNNIHVWEETNKLCETYFTTDMSMAEFTEELRKTIQWQEAGRCEYEIRVGSLFRDNYEQWDCYKQVLPNIDILAHYVIYKYGAEYETTKTLALFTE